MPDVQMASIYVLELAICSQFCLSLMRHVRRERHSKPLSGHPISWHVVVDMKLYVQILDELICNVMYGESVVVTKVMILLDLYGWKCFLEFTILPNTNTSGSACVQPTRYSIIVTFNSQVLKIGSDYFEIRYPSLHNRLHPILDSYS